jgi:protease-4
MSARRGVLIFLGLLTVLGGAVLLSALLVRRASTVIPSAAVLVFHVPPELDESEAPSSGYTMDILRHDAPTTWQIVHGIREAAHDDGVEAMVLHIDGVDWGWATVAEVRDALLEFRSAGKALYASFTGGGEREYLLATAAPMVGAPPLAMLQLDGVDGLRALLARDVRQAGRDSELRACRTIQVRGRGVHAYGDVARSARSARSPSGRRIPTAAR